MYSEKQEEQKLILSQKQKYQHTSIRFGRLDLHDDQLDKVALQLLRHIPSETDTIIVILKIQQVDDRLITTSSHTSL